MDAHPYQFIALPDIPNLAYTDEGSGKTTLVFVHGLSSYALSWKKNIEYLKTKYRCIAIDLPGNGLTAYGPYSYSIPFFARVVHDFIQAMQLTRVCLVGHSMGGQIAIYTATEYPDCASSLILCAPAGFETFTPVEKNIYFNTLQFLGFFSSEANSLRKVIQSSFFHYTMQAEDMIADLISLLQRYPIHEYRKMTEACIRGMLEEPVWHRLRQIKQRTQVIFGERDALIPNRVLHPITTADVARAGTREIPHAQLSLIPQAGHFVHWEKASVCNEIINDFLNEQY